MQSTHRMWPNVHLGTEMYSTMYCSMYCNNFCNLYAIQLYILEYILVVQINIDIHFRTNFRQYRRHSSLNILTTAYHFLSISCNYQCTDITCSIKKRDERSSSENTQQEERKKNGAHNRLVCANYQLSFAGPLNAHIIACRPLPCCRPTVVPHDVVSVLDSLWGMGRVERGCDVVWIRDVASEK
jgi:hypothetical protein